MARLFLLSLITLLASHAAPVRAQAGPDLPEIETRAYRIRSDLHRDDFRRVGEHMDLVYRELDRRFSGFPVYGAGKLPLWVFSEQDDYLEALGGQGVNGLGTAGMFFARPETGRVLASWVGDRPIEDVLGTLRHEGTHQIVSQRLGSNLPQWLNEGLAEYFQFTLFGKRRSSLGLVDPASLVRLHLLDEGGRLLPFEELLTLTNARWNELVNTGDARAGVMYPQAWSIVHFLVEGEGGKYERLLVDLLKELSRGVPQSQAIRNAFGSDLEPMEAAWRNHLDAMEPDPMLVAHLRLEAAARVLTAAGQNVEYRTLGDLRELAGEHADAGRPGILLTGLLGSEPDWWTEPVAGSPAMSVRQARRAPMPELVIKSRRHTLKLAWSQREGVGLVPRIEVE